VTFEEARAQFPVLERLAYLNAGSMGPPRVDAGARDGDREVGLAGRGRPHDRDNTPHA
jgi:hypothetical protein